MQKINRRSLVLAAAGLALGGAAIAQDTYPSRPIKWIVPYLAGTAPDITVRIAAEAMSDILKQPVVVDNKGGAAGNLGAQIAARAPADGYTWVYSATPMATNMRMYRKPGFDVMKDFDGLAAAMVVLAEAAYFDEHVRFAGTAGGIARAVRACIRAHQPGSESRTVLPSSIPSPGESTTRSPAVIPLSTCRSFCALSPSVTERRSTFPLS